MKTVFSAFLLACFLFLSYASQAQVSAGTATAAAPATLDTSDARYRQHVRPLTGALAAVEALHAVRYDWNALGVQHGGVAGAGQVGLLALEVEKSYPELVSTDKDGFKAVNYAQLTPVLIQALQEQGQQIVALEKMVTAASRRTSTASAASVQRDAQADATVAALEQRLRALESGATRAVAQQH